MIDVRETVAAYELLPGDVVEWAGRLWTCAGSPLGDLRVRLVELEDPGDGPAVLSLDRRVPVVRVRHAEPVVYGAPFEWAIHPIETPPTGEASSSQRFATLHAALDGVRFAAYDVQVLHWLASVTDLPEAATIASQIVRARAVGPHPSTAPHDTYLSHLAVELARAREEIQTLRDQLGGSQTPPEDSGARAGHDASDAAMAAEPAPAPAELHDWTRTLLDPDCRDGKHRSCTGGDCTCGCHAEGVPA